MDQIDRFRGALLGLAVGDAVGTTVEFKPCGTFPKVTDMAGGGPFRLEPGQWTDDTSMALCLATSLLERNGFDARNQMDRYCRWMDEGYLSSNGRCFDVGGTVRAALSRYKRTGEPFAGSTDPGAAGNGSLMRLAPVVMFFYPDHDAAIRYAGESSRTTHGAAECVEACRFMATMLCRAFDGASKENILFGTTDKALSYACEKNGAIAHGQYREKSVSAIRGSGYVVESLEAALWCFDSTDSFETAIRRAANLGDDADTTAAICGQIAGAVFGASGIPEQWLSRLAMRSFIEDLSVQLYRAGERENPGQGMSILHILPCFDSDQMADSRRQDLDIHTSSAWAAVATVGDEAPPRGACKSISAEAGRDRRGPYPPVSPGCRASVSVLWIHSATVRGRAFRGVSAAR